MDSELDITLDDLVYRNYYEIVDESCPPSVLAYLDEHDSVLGEDAVFVKQLTKIGTNMLACNPKSLSCAQLVKLFTFNVEGFELIRRDRADGHKHRWWDIMEAHFFSHAGNVARHLYEQTQKTHWLRQAYQAAKMSYEIGVEVDPQHAGYNASFAADHAQMLYTFTLEENFIEDAYRLHREASDLLAQVDKRTAGFSAFSAAKDADHAYKIGQRIFWLERMWQAYARSAELLASADEIGAAATAYSRAGRFGLEAYQSRCPVPTPETIAGYYEKGVELTSQKNVDSLGKVMKWARDGFSALMRDTKDVKWKKRFEQLEARYR